MKTKISENNTFPRLMICKDGKTIILVSKAVGDCLVGFVVHSTDETFPVGYGSTTFVKNMFVDFTGEVTLKND